MRWWWICNRLVLVGVADVDVAGGKTEVAVVPRSRPEISLVRAITKQVVSAKANGIDLLEVRLSESWLPKHLMQAHRRFHAPKLFGAVLELHRVVKDLEMAVSLVGPVEPTEPLLEAIRQARRDACSREMTHPLNPEPPPS